MRRRLLMIAAVAAAATSAAFANDSTAEKAAGGLVLTRTDAIDMVSEDLYVSPQQVRVAYVFRNRTNAPIRTTVAFPMPDRNLDEMSLSDTAYPGQFRTLVDGQPVTMQVERRALLNGVDHTAMLAGLGIPVQTGDPASDVLTRALLRLRPADRQRLIAMGLAGDGGGDLHPMWTVKETYYWEQVFPAGRDLDVRHSYSPGTGGSVAVALSFADYRNSSEGRAEQRRYCTDRAFMTALDRMAGRDPQRIVVTQQKSELHPHHGRQLAFADRPLPDGGRQAQSARDHELLRRGRAPDFADPVRDPPPQLAADAGPPRPDRRAERYEPIAASPWGQ